MSIDNDDATIGGCFGVIIFAIILSIVLWTKFGALDITYSEGYRDGYVQKFSQKGVVWKSWEGQLATPGLVRQDGKLSGVFEFTVVDPSVRALLEVLPQDRMVRLHYRQVFKSPDAFYDTDYRITRVESLKRNENVDPRQQQRGSNPNSD